MFQKVDYSDLRYIFVVITYGPEEEKKNKNPFLKFLFCNINFEDELYIRYEPKKMIIAKMLTIATPLAQRVNQNSKRLNFRAHQIGHDFG